MVYQQTKLRKWISLSNLSWSQLSHNLNAIELLKDNPHKIDWYKLSTNQNAIEILKKNKDKIDWDNLSNNPDAIKLLKDNLEKIDWYMISSNPSIFTYDYELIKKNFKELGDKIIRKGC